MYVKLATAGLSMLAVLLILLYIVNAGTELTRFLGNNVKLLVMDVISYGEKGFKLIKKGLNVSKELSNYSIAISKEISEINNTFVKLIINLNSTLTNFKRSYLNEAMTINSSNNLLILLNETNIDHSGGSS